MANSTQQAIDIAGIKDGVIVMKDGSYRLLLQVAATNFALKSEQEQNSIVFQYQSFLNSLHFPIEIVISSRRLDLTPYIAKIEKLSEKQTTELIKMQTLDYMDFLKKLVDIANIMKKTFYVVVAFSPLNIKKVGLFGSLFGNKKSSFEHLKISDADFKAHTDQLKQRASTVASGLGGMGLHCFQLSTEQLIELFYLMYNPDEATKERFQDVTLLSSPVIMSKDEAKSEDIAGPQTTQEEDAVIDNAAQVTQQRHDEALAKKQEAQKEAEKGVRSAPSKEVKAQPVSNQPAQTAPQQQTVQPVTAAPSATAAPVAAPTQANTPTAEPATAPTTAPAQPPTDSQNIIQ
ncbi:hypothetical protein COT78_03745 [Candidatus Berkelbacteria bacterium CG10_big_fil_rev_8_21_14_0_10_43_13]|uniref:TraC-like domain-containing protein n=1 Tax=Candidatus Berkelbacteria bacterium CG10_big_fil_rev_8_21_14_0_10_43_13 TaxID=1974514 RepID=A0A2H0W5Q7_9BACT|nr:MAG: hypothetical protein COT78_03745 [Candidatus Berkelbacteria bacterium CG10_big_fil_rev_8_21_14_0_10_43_13]